MQKKLLSIKDKEITIFTDGSSRGNPGPGGYGAVAIYQNSHGEVMVDEVGGGEKETTNNRMELTAVIEGIKNFLFYYENLSEYNFTIYTDSSYVLKGAKEWLYGWKKNGWVSSTKSEVKNQDLWQIYDDLVSKGDGKGQLKISWQLLKGHSGVPGNERCDFIATMFADGKHVDLYTGSLVKYQENICGGILELDGSSDSFNKNESKSSEKKSTGKKAYSYVSLINGQVFVDKTWQECEKRVKGVSGAKYKKSVSSDDENSIISEFSI